MSDQANKLRELAFTATETSYDAVARVPMVVVTGAKAGVGATTVAVNLAAVLADQGERVAVVDAAQHSNDLAEVAGIGREFEYSLSDVMAGKCSAVDALATSSAGMRVLANRGRVHRGGLAVVSRRNAATVGESSRHDQQRLLSELDSLGDAVDLLVVDTGYGLTPWSRRFWTQARLVVLVTTTDDASVLAAYTALKLSAADSIRPAMRAVVNRCDSDLAAEDANRRMQNACRRFLSLAVESLPALPRQDDEAVAGARGWPRVWETPNSAFGRAALWMGRGVSDALNERMQDAGCRGQGFNGKPPFLHSASNIL